MYFAEIFFEVNMCDRNCHCISANVYRFGEGREIELLLPALEPMLNKV